MVIDRIFSATLLVGIALWAGSLALYVSTLAPTLSWGADGFGVDGGELLAAAKTLGIPHPPGYPTYTLLLKLFATVVPIGDFAFRGNLMSAVLASVSVALLYYFIFRLCKALRPDGSRLYWIGGAVLGASSFATSPLFWSQATITEVYTLNTLFTGLLLFISSHMVFGTEDEKSSPLTVAKGRMSLFALMLGLGMGNHLTLLAIAVPLLYWIKSSRGWGMLVSPWTIGALVLGLGVYLYLPMRAVESPPVNWGGADSLGGMAWMLTGRAYQDYLFGVPVHAVPDRLVSWVQLTFSQFNPLGVFIGLIGAAVLVANRPRFFLVSLSSVAALSFYSLVYGTVDFEVLMIPAFMLFSVWVGVGFLWAMLGVSTWVERVRTTQNYLDTAGLRSLTSYAALLMTLIAIAALPLASAILNYRSQDLKADKAAYAYARQVSEALPEGSVVLSIEEGQAFSLWYMRFVEETNRDFAPVAVPLLQFDWYWRNMQSQFPDRFPGDAPEDHEQALKRIVEHNSGDSGVFFTYRDRSLERFFELEQVGNLYEAIPRNQP